MCMLLDNLEQAAHLQEGIVFGEGVESIEHFHDDEHGHRDGGGVPVLEHGAGRLAVTPPRPSHLCPAQPWAPLRTHQATTFFQDAFTKVADERNTDMKDKASARKWEEGLPHE